MVVDPFVESEIVTDAVDGSQVHPGLPFLITAVDRFLRVERLEMAGP